MPEARYAIRCSSAGQGADCKWRNPLRVSALRALRHFQPAPSGGGVARSAALARRLSVRN